MMHYSAISPSARAGGEISLLKGQIELAWESYSMNHFGIAVCTFCTGAGLRMEESRSASATFGRV
jgi:hypothetical protein